MTNISEPSLRLEYAELVDEYAPPRGAFVLATRRAATVACGAIRPFAGHDDIAEVKRMWVHPSEHGRGVGAATLAELERLSREYGYLRARLDTNENLTAAIRMYERAGYRASTVSTTRRTQPTSTRSASDAARPSVTSKRLSAAASTGRPRRVPGGGVA